MIWKTPTKKLIKESEIQMEHRQVLENHRVTLWGSSIQITDLTNAGKRGKFCVQYRFNFHNMSKGIIDAEIFFLDAYYTNMDETIANLKNKFLESTEIFYLKGVDVSPDLPSIELSTDKWYLYCRIDDRGSFDLTISDKTDSYNDPTIIFSHRNTKTEKAKVYKLISENQEYIKTLDRMGDVYDFIHTSTGIYLHSYCAVD